MESYELKYQLADRNAPLEFVGYAAEGRLSSASYSWLDEKGPANEHASDTHSLREQAVKASHNLRRMQNKHPY